MIVRMSRRGFRDELVRRGQALIAARPTAVNLSWAVEQMLDFAATKAAALAEADGETVCINKRPNCLRPIALPAEQLVLRVRRY